MDLKTLSNDELATILAALRLWQREHGQFEFERRAELPEEFQCYFDDCDPLDENEIDALIEKINWDIITSNLTKGERPWDNTTSL